jgi:hypothetical protein
LPRWLSCWGTGLPRICSNAGLFRGFTYVIFRERGGGQGAGGGEVRGDRMVNFVQ